MSASISTTQNFGVSVSESLIGRGPGDWVVSDPCPFANGTGRARFGKTRAPSATLRRFFVPAAIVSMAAGIGTPSGVPVPVFRSCTPDVSRHPIVVQGDGDGFQPNTESSMNQSTKGEIRPQSVPNRPTHETLIGVLAELEAAADLVEQLLTHGHDEAVLATITQSLAEMLALLGGGRHG